MKKLLVLTSLLASLVFANNNELETCKKCHPIIVDEFKSSMHKNSSIKGDEIHAAVWNIHPLKEQGKYACAECHTPNHQEGDDPSKGITCTTCHTITDIQEHQTLNKNIYGEDKKTFYSAEKGRENEKVVYKKESTWLGFGTKTVGSPYHNIDYTNEKFYNGQVCMGCHSHRQNSHEFDLCRTEDGGAKDKESNCISCHMPKIDGSATTIRESKTHAFHGFAGSVEHSDMISKYIDLDFAQKGDGFSVTVANNTPHKMLSHPLRVAELRVSIISGGKTTPLESVKFARVIGTQGQPSMPWSATEVISDTMIKADEKRVVDFKQALKSGDSVEVTIGYYLVNPKSLDKLGLRGNKKAEKFTILKQKYFNIK